MEYISPSLYGARPGDVVHVRGSSVYSRLILRCLPETWGTHDGTLVVDDGGNWHVAEALLRGFGATPWAAYCRRVMEGREALAFLRPTNVPEAISRGAHAWAWYMVRAAPRYDWRSILRITVNMALKTNLRNAVEWRWYCTEAVAWQYHWADPALHEFDVWGLETLPTPYTTEKRVRSGRLSIVEHGHDVPDLGLAAFRGHLAAKAV